MERGQLGIENQTSVVFVFEGLIAKISQPRLERLAIRAHQWESALALWEFDVQVCDYITTLVVKHEVPVDVITWHAKGFAEALHDRLWALDVPVRSTRERSYAAYSHRAATDNFINLVYDPDPAHRFGYGFKAREFSTGRL